MFIPVFFILISMIIACSIHAILVKKREAEERAEAERRELEILYYDQNTAFSLCYEPKKRFFYHGIEDGDKISL